MKGLTDKEFQRQWNENCFFTGGDNQLLYTVAKKILTKDKIDSILLCILRRIEDYKKSPARQKFKPRPDLRSKTHKLQNAQREIQAELAVPVEFQPSEQEIKDALKLDETLRQRYAPKNLDKVQSGLQSGKYNEFLTALTVIDGYPQTKPTSHVQTFFACALAASMVTSKPAIDGHLKTGH